MDYRLEESQKKAAVFLNDNLSELFSSRSSSFISLFSQPRPPLFSLTRTKHPSLGHTSCSYKVTLTAVLFILFFVPPLLYFSFSLRTVVSPYQFEYLFFFILFFSHFFSPNFLTCKSCDPTFGDQSFYVFLSLSLLIYDLHIQQTCWKSYNNPYHYTAV